MAPRSTERHLYWLAGGLAFIGLGIFLFKFLLLEFPLRPQQQSDIWDLEVRLSYVAAGGPARLSLLIPKDSRRFRLVDEVFVSHGYGLLTANPGSNRQVVWSNGKARGRQVLFYKTAVRAIRPSEATESASRPRVVPPRLSPAAQEAAKSLAADIQPHAGNLSTLVQALLQRLNDPQPDDHVRLLLGNKPDRLKVTGTAVKVLRYLEIPARAAHGVRLTRYTSRVPIQHWLQVHDGKAWRSYDPVSGETPLPDDYFTWWRGNTPLAALEGGRGLSVEITTGLNKEAALSAAAARSEARVPGLSAVSLYRLPLDTQLVYRVLLTVPVGVLILVLLRNLVGLRTFGTFMPVLIALAFRETLLLWGVALFCVIVALGLAIRFYLERLKLLLVPRLAAVVIVVIMLMALISLVSHRLGLPQGLSIALFPMVIITMTIERMSIVWEERGPGEALIQAAGSLVAASLSYLVMSRRELEHLVFVFPELLLVLLAVILLLGRYTGYRLLELSRFKALAVRE